MHIQVGIGPHRRALLLGDELQQVPIVPPRILRRRPRLVGVTLRRPAGLRDLQADILVAELLHCGVGGVDLGVEHVVVVKARPGVHDAGARPEQHEIERHLLWVGLVGEVGVRIDLERRPHLAVEVEDARQLGGEIAAEGAGGGRVGDFKDGEVVGGGDGDLLVEVEGDEGGVDALHGGEEVGGESGVVECEDLVADGNAGDLGRRQEALHVRFDPREGLLRIAHPGQVLIAEPDDELDAGVGERL